MPGRTSFADTVFDLEQLHTSVSTHPTLVPSAAERYRSALEELLTQLKTLSSTQKTLRADKQKVTQDLKETLRQGRRLATDVRTVIRGEVGIRSEKLVEFGIAPLRPRPRRKVETEEPVAPRPS
jgi:phage terminase Nu1 subunit (DNA packaging protein)